MKPANSQEDKSPTVGILMEKLLEKKIAAQTRAPTPRLIYEYTEDHFCSGLITHITQTYRRMHLIPFKVCIISHTGLVCETTRGATYYVEFVEGNPVMIHEITIEWRKRRKDSWEYGGYHWHFETRYRLKIVSFNIEYVAKCYEALAGCRGAYVLSGNNCHVVTEELIRILNLRSCGVNMHYGSYLGVGELPFNPEESLMPVFYL